MKLFVAFVVTSAFFAGCGPMDPDDDETVDSRDDANTVCADGQTVPGIDVSHWQGAVNWMKVKGAGYEFGVAKATEGTGFVDPQFKANWSALREAGMVRGAYHFFRAGDDAGAQANHFLDTVGDLGEDDLPLILDLESNDGVSDATVISRAKAFLAEIETKTGRTPMLYSGYFFKSLGSPAGFAKYPLWIPQYGPTCPDIPEAGWSTWTVFQYTSDKTVPGVSGGCDADKFNGTLADLKALASPPNEAANGKLESATCDGVKGWAQDPDAPAKAAKVQIFADGGPKAGKKVLDLTADEDRQDLCDTLGSCKHGFSAEIPDELVDGKEHVLRAYAVDLQAGTTALLAGSPKSITCTPPANQDPGTTPDPEPTTEPTPETAAPAASDDSGGCAVSRGRYSRRVDPLALLAACGLAELARRRRQHRARTNAASK